MNRLTIFLFFLITASIVKAQKPNDTVSRELNALAPVAAPGEPALTKQDEVFTAVEIQPACRVDFLSFIAQNVHYPASAYKNGIQGKVFVQFVVGRDGRLSNEQIVRSVSPELDAEAIRVVKMSPPWRPGIQNGQPVSVIFTVPITFRLNTPAIKNDTSGTTKRTSTEDELAAAQPIGHTDDGPCPGDPNQIFASVQQEPTFNGSYSDYVHKSMRGYESDSKGVVTVSFVVEMDGKATNVKVIKSLSNKNDAEAAKLIQNSKWHPGIQNGCPVRCFFQAPVLFASEDNQ